MLVNPVQDVRFITPWHPDHQASYTYLEQKINRMLVIKLERTLLAFRVSTAKNRFFYTMLSITR
jgi:hypothetical protein